MEEKKMIGVVLGVLVVAFVSGCATLKEAKKFHDMSGYKYAIISQTASHTSGSGGTSYGRSSGVIAYSAVSKSVNPADVIAGILMKKGYVVVDKSDRDGAFLVKYGQGDSRMLGEILEITIQMLDSKTHEPLFICTAEGKWGDTESDNIRKAITRCLRDF